MSDSTNLIKDIILLCVPRSLRGPRVPSKKPLKSTTRSFGYTGQQTRRSIEACLKTTKQLKPRPPPFAPNCSPIILPSLTLRPSVWHPAFICLPIARWHAPRPALSANVSPCHPSGTVAPNPGSNIDIVFNALYFNNGATFALKRWTALL